ncbi:MAG: methyl-accepting chemotaxis protein [Clostridia bacterium]|nr:methyl-accepting chemotaxis protein [Clostridia bacterium]
MDKLKLSTKLIALILICTFGMVLIGAFGDYQMKIVNNSVEKMYFEFMQGLTMLGELRTTYEEISKLTFLYQLSNEQEELEKVEKEIALKLEQVAANITNFYINTKDPIVRGMMDEIVKKLAVYNKYRETLITEKREGTLQSDLKELFTYQDDIQRAIKELEDYHQNYSKSLYTNSTKVYNDSRKILFAMILVSVILAILFEAVIYWSIVNPIKSLIKIAQKLKKYDLTVQIENDYQETEIGQLLSALNEAVLNLRSFIGQIEVTAEKTAQASNKVVAVARETEEGAMQTANTVEDLAKTTQQQMHQALVMTNAVEKVESAVRKITESYQKAQKDTAKANFLSQEGNMHIERIVEQMEIIRQVSLNIGDKVEELGGLSSRIGEIIEIIGGIAQQTNLLALNAAIEAANAGEHGRGFAVVAEEVRQLAEQSGESVEQIDKLVTKIQQGVEKAITVTNKGVKEVQIGTEIVEKSGKSFGKIMLAVAGIKEAVNAVGISTEEISSESQALKEIIFESIRAYQSISAHTQEVSATAEEQAMMMFQTVKSTTDLSALSKKLKKSIEHFKV